jgi:hypothetical protein
MFSMARSFDERELSPIFEDTLPVVRAVLGREPSPALLERLAARHGRRSTSEQPDTEQRQRYALIDLFPARAKLVRRAETS